ncbi:hypothetical protein P308_03655 [Pseudomonas piscis]|nr:hypothetical protein P308_03655 [Pseudomonas piscis]
MALVAEPVALVAEPVVPAEQAVALVAEPVVPAEQAVELVVAPAALAVVMAEQAAPAEPEVQAGRGEQAPP